MATFKPFLLLISLLALALVSSSITLPGGLSEGNFATCELVFYVKTLSDPCAGTTSNVSIRVIYWRGGATTIPNLVEWNRLPPPPHGHFQAGRLDTFVGPVDCNPNRVRPCYLNITITGTGHSPTWGLEYIQVRSPELVPTTFPVNDWLTPENNYSIFVATICPRFSTGMSGSTKSSLAI